MVLQLLLEGLIMGSYESTLHCNVKGLFHKTKFDHLEKESAKLSFHIGP